MKESSCSKQIKLKAAKEEEAKAQQRAQQQKERDEKERQRRKQEDAHHEQEREKLERSYRDKRRLVAERDRRHSPNDRDRHRSPHDRSRRQSPHEGRRRSSHVHTSSRREGDRSRGNSARPESGRQRAKSSEKPDEPRQSLASQPKSPSPPLVLDAPSVIGAPHANALALEGFDPLGTAQGISEQLLGLGDAAPLRRESIDYQTPVPDAGMHPQLPSHQLSVLEYDGLTPREKASAILCAALLAYLVKNSYCLLQESCIRLTSQCKKKRCQLRKMPLFLETAILGKKNLKGCDQIEGNVKQRTLAMKTISQGPQTKASKEER